MRNGAILLAVAVTALVPARVSRAAAPPAGVPFVQRPNPALAGIRLDYEAPLQAAGGGTASLAPLQAGVTLAAVRDRAFLVYELRDDLGGFAPAPVGAFALSSGGRATVGTLDGAAEIPLFSRQAGGEENSFAFAGAPVGPSGRPDNGKQPVPGIGVPIPVPTPAPGNEPPPANQGFGGGQKGGGGTTTTKRRPPSPTPTTTTSPPPATATTSTTVTTARPATAGPRPGGGGGGGGTTPIGGPECGTPGISIHSNLSGCKIDAVDMNPGDSTSELVQIRNTSSSTYTLSLEATGTQNHLWQDLRMAVVEQGTPAPSPLPPLLYWTTQYNDLTTLAPGETVTYVIELYLPSTAGNVDQSLAAVIDFDWQATG